MPDSSRPDLDVTREHFGRALSRLTLDGGSGVWDLRLAVGEYVDALRSRGEAPERVIAQVKEVVAAQLGPGVSPRDLRELMTTVVKWSIQAYYRPSPKTPPRAPDDQQRR